MLRSLKDVLKFISVRVPAAFTADANTTGVDVSDFGSCTFLVHVGATTGNDFGASHKVDIIVQHADVDTDGSYAAAAAADIYSPEVGASGIAKALDGTEDASKVHVVHYRGDKRYVRIRLDETGTVDAPIGVVAVLGHSELMPPL